MPQDCDLSATGERFWEEPLRRAITIWDYNSTLRLGKDDLEGRLWITTFLLALTLISIDARGPHDAENVVS